MNLNVHRKKLWLDKGSEFYNRSIKSCLRDNDIEIYLVHTEENSVVAEKFIRVFRNKIDKHQTAVSKKCVY